DDMARMRSAHSTSRRVRSVARCAVRSSPAPAAARIAPPAAADPGNAPAPADRTSMPSQPLASTFARPMTSAIGLRHVLPVQTKRTWKLPCSGGRIESEPPPGEAPGSRWRSFMDLRDHAAQTLHGDTPRSEDDGHGAATVDHGRRLRWWQGAGVDHENLLSVEPLRESERVRPRARRRPPRLVQARRCDRPAPCLDEPRYPRMGTHTHTDGARPLVTHAPREDTVRVG